MKTTAMIVLCVMISACDSPTTMSRTSAPTESNPTTLSSVVTSARVDDALRCLELADWCRFKAAPPCKQVKMSAIEAFKVDEFFAQNCSI